MLKTIGSDMEVFAQDRDGHHVALCGKIGGTKQEPLQIKSLPTGFMLQEDNVALEFNIPVCVSRNSFVSSFKAMNLHIAKELSLLGLMVSKEASVSFDKKELTHPNALVFGCEPDYSAWSQRENRKPQAKDENLRTCGGHIHVGTDVNMIQGVKNMDLLLGIPSVILDDSPSSIARRELYGKAGAMRPKPYGFEYRTLSNFWMFSDRLVEWIFSQTQCACLYTKNITLKEGKRIQNCINSGDKNEANILIREYNIVMP